MSPLAVGLWVWLIFDDLILGITAAFCTAVFRDDKPRRRA